MNNCKKCNAFIRDNAKICPLCGSPLILGGDERVGVGYPDVTHKIIFMRLIIKIVLFASVVAEGILLFLDYLLNKTFSWSMITAVCLAFGCFTMVYSFQNDKSLQRKLVVQLIAAIAVLLLLNRIIGHGHWAMVIGVPAAIAAIEGSVVVLLFTNLSHWQVYVMAQVYICLISVIMLLISIFNRQGTLLFMIAATAFSLMVLAGMVVFGGHHATNELKRRFRV